MKTNAPRMKLNTILGNKGEHTKDGAEHDLGNEHTEDGVEHDPREWR